VNSVRDLEIKIFNRVNPAVKFSITRYVLAIGLFVAVVVFGIVSLLGLGVDLLPSVNMPVVMIATSFPGATPGVVDQQVSQVIENVVSTVSGITDINSTSSMNSSRVMLAFDMSTDRNSAANQVAALVSAATRRLPSGVNPPTVQTFDPNSEAVIQFGLSADGKNLADVGDYVQNTLVPALQRVSGVANIQVDGAPSSQFQVLLRPDRMRFYDLSPQQVINAIANFSINQPIGTIVSNNNSLTFTTENVPTGGDEISKVLVDSARGIRVSDLAGIRAKPATSGFARVNGRPSVLVSVQRTTDSNSISVVQGVRKLLAATILPTGYEITVSNDTTGPIQASVASTYRELIITGLVVALIVLLFLGKLNTAFSVILAIPIALSAAPVLYRLSGFSLNLVSLLALIIAIGVVVDDSIVVAENVERYRALGFGLKESVLKGASEVFSAVVAASLSILSVLIPVSFIGGFMGRYLQQFSLGLAAAVAFSLLEAVLFLTVRLAYMPDTKAGGWRDFAKSFTFLPASLRWGFSGWRLVLSILLSIGVAAYALLQHHVVYLAGVPVALAALGLVYFLGRIVLTLLQAITSMLHGWTEKALEWIRDGYARTLGRLLKRSAWVLVGVGIGLGAVAVLVVPRIPINFVPQTDSGTLQVNLRMPQGTPAIVTNAVAGRLEAFLIQRPEVKTIQCTVGGNAQMLLQLVPVGERPGVTALTTTYRQALTGLLRDQPSARVSVSAGGGFMGQGTGLSLNVVSADSNLLRQRNAQIIQIIQNNPWVADVTSSLSDTTLENQFVPDDASMQGTGLNPNAIADALQTYTSGTTAASVVLGGLSYPIQVISDPTYIRGGESLLDLPIYSPALQTSVPAGQLGKFELKQAPNSINRYNRQYTGQLNLTLKAGAPTALELQTQITQDLKTAGLLDNGVSLTANSRFSQAALASQLVGTGSMTFLLALFLAYLVMAAQFNSWRYPIYLLLPVPLALIGALLLVFFMGGGLDVFGLMGMLMLIGLSAKNAILYLDFVVERIGQMPFKDALIEAARLRFRPIIMTTLTVLVISFPLIFGRGQGSEFGQKMGVVMLGGIVFSAILTFFVVPTAFYLFERKRVAKQEQGAESAVALGE
jgi:hydrophobic/amphiphilic exporter-1 (mainly G- bacteria), HAE1 family